MKKEWELGSATTTVLIAYYLYNIKIKCILYGVKKTYKFFFMCARWVIGLCGLLFRKPQPTKPEQKI